MAGELEIRPATPDDRNAILDLMRLSLGEGDIPRHEAFWAWKHEQNPFGASPVLLATAQGELVGLRVFMRWLWGRDGETLQAVRAVDTATHPDWRGRGIFSRLTRALLDRMNDEGVALVFNTPNEKSRPGYLKMGWQDVGRVSLWIRPIRPVRLLSLVTRRGEPDLEDSAEAAAQHIGSDAGALFQVDDLDRFLSGSSAPVDRLATPRTSEYLGWRYARVPGIRYRAIWEIDGSTGAMIVFRLKPRGSLRELRLCDVLVGAGSRSARVARELIRQLSREAGADFVSAMAVTGGRRAGVLAATGFLPAPRLGPRMTVRPMAGRPADLDIVHRSSWHLSIGDLELF